MLIVAKEIISFTETFSQVNLLRSWVFKLTKKEQKNMGKRAVSENSLSRSISFINLGSDRVGDELIDEGRGLGLAVGSTMPAAVSLVPTHVLVPTSSSIAVPLDADVTPDDEHGYDGNSDDDECSVGSGLGLIQEDRSDEDIEDWELVDNFQQIRMGLSFPPIHTVTPAMLKLAAIADNIKEFSSQEWDFSTGDLGIRWKKVLSYSEGRVKAAAFFSEAFKKVTVTVSYKEPTWWESLWGNTKIPVDTIKQLADKVVLESQNLGYGSDAVFTTIGFSYDSSIAEVLGLALMNKRVSYNVTTYENPGSRSIISELVQQKYFNWTSADRFYEENTTYLSQEKYKMTSLYQGASIIRVLKEDVVWEGEPTIDQYFTSISAIGTHQVVAEDRDDLPPLVDLPDDNTPTIQVKLFSPVDDNVNILGGDDDDGELI